jgi:hypothetical protein
MVEHLKNAAWLAAFAIFCAVFGLEVYRASTQPPQQGSAESWICPILGKCGPPGTPGLGRW